MARLSEHGIRLSSMSPSFLNSNSTSHTWPFSAVAELIDNASDPGVSAKQIWIDVSQEAGYSCLSFTDNGSGMTPNKLHKMLSFGFTDKGTGKASLQAIGVYGNGFKSGSMRLGRDALIFTKNGGCQTVGLLSQTYLEAIKAQAVIVPIVPFNQQTKSLVVTEDSEASLAAILQYSIITSQEQIQSHFDSIASKKGTKILIWNTRKAKDGKPELDLESDESDIRLPEIQIEELKKSLKSSGALKAEQSVPDLHYSLRAYLSILYLKPRTQIILRGKKILASLVSKRLVHIEHDVYKPHFSKEKVRVTFGLTRKNKDHYGIMMYHKNRLIKAYEKVGCQLKTSGQRVGVGVIGVIECNFLKPAHNKQDFEYTKEYRLTLGALGLKLNDYWRELTQKKAREREFRSVNTDDEDEESQDSDEAPMWLQCEECLKWRSVPAGLYNATPESWNCSQNPNPRYRSCSSREETEESEELLTPSYQKNHKKQENLRTRKREKSLELCEEQDQASKRHTLSRSSSEPNQPTDGSAHTPQHTDRRGNLHREKNTHDDQRGWDWLVSNDERTDSRVTLTNKEDKACKQEADGNADKGPKTLFEDNGNSHPKDSRSESVQINGGSVDPFSPKRKLGSAFYCVQKRPYPWTREQAESGSTTEELHPETRTNMPKRWSPERNWQDGGHREVNRFPPTTLDSRSPPPPEGADRESSVQRLAKLEREAQSLRKLLGLENESETMPASVTSPQRWNKQTKERAAAAAAATKDIACQTSAPEGATLSSGPALTPGHQGMVVPHTVYGSNRSKKNESECERMSRVIDTDSEGYGCEDSRSVQDNLHSIRNNVVVLLTSLLPQLDLTGISFDTPDVDNILQQIIEVNSLKL